MVSEVFNEDCMIGMERYPDKYFDLAVVDPPYGIGEMGQRNVSGDRPTLKWKNPKSINYKPFDDSKVPEKKYWSELFRVSKNQIVWGGNYFTEFLPSSKGWIVWDKKVDIKEHLSMCELAWTSYDKKCNKYEYLWAGFKKKHPVERVHPTQKPVSLYDWIYKNYLPHGGKVIDTHLGSGSNRIAADKAGNIDFYGWELDTDYYNASEKRFQDYKKQLILF